jgi:hypothetical protein
MIQQYPVQIIFLVFFARVSLCVNHIDPLEGLMNLLVVDLQVSPGIEIPNQQFNVIGHIGDRRLLEDIVILAVPYFAHQPGEFSLLLPFLLKDGPFQVSALRIAVDFAAAVLCTADRANDRVNRRTVSLRFFL